jgi:branched-chain amino acid aminotransferase
MTRTSEPSLRNEPPPAPTGPFGTEFVDTMTTATWTDGSWSEPATIPTGPISLHPAAHSLHYASACFEGLKAHRGTDGEIRIFRLDRHVDRMRQSAETLMLPVPPSDMLAEMIRTVVRDNRSEIPAAPGSLYLRPTLLGTEPNIGAAAAPSQEALLYVLGSPVGDYFRGGIRPLKIAIETERPRTTPQFGMVKSGANYAMALGVTQEAKRTLGIDQVLFAPGGDVTETGASNFVLIDDERIVTKGLDESFLHGITRDSVLRIGEELGYLVEERDLDVAEILGWRGEAALTGTAAILAGVGWFVYHGESHPVGDATVGPNTLRLRKALTDLQIGERPDPNGWNELV